MARLDKEKQETLEPIRIANAVKSITGLGYIVHSQTQKEIRFMFKGSEVKFFPYSGWHTGKTIVDGRGLRNLIRQIEPETKP